MPEEYIALRLSQPPAGVTELTTSFTNPSDRVLRYASPLCYCLIGKPIQFMCRQTIKVVKYCFSLLVTLFKKIFYVSSPIQKDRIFVSQETGAQTGALGSSVASEIPVASTEEPPPDLPSPSGFPLGGCSSRLPSSEKIFIDLLLETERKRAVFSDEKLKAFQSLPPVYQQTVFKAANQKGRYRVVRALNTLPETPWQKIDWKAQLYGSKKVEVRIALVCPGEGVDRARASLLRFLRTLWANNRIQFNLNGATEIDHIISFPDVVCWEYLRETCDYLEIENIKFPTAQLFLVSENTPSFTVNASNCFEVTTDRIFYTSDRESIEQEASQVSLTISCSQPIQQRDAHVTQFCLKNGPKKLSKKLTCAFGRLMDATGYGDPQRLRILQKGDDLYILGAKYIAFPHPDKKSRALHQEYFGERYTLRFSKKSIQGPLKRQKLKA